MFSFFTGRSNRQEYWISVVLLIVVAVVLSYMRMQAASAAITVMWVLTWMRRLHDIGKPGWFALFPVVIGVILVFAGFALGGPAFMKAIGEMQTSSNPPALPDNMLYLALGVVLAAAVVQFGFTIWLGVKKGDAGDNRFGSPPPSLRG